MTKVLSSKAPGEEYPVTFDFAGLLGAVTSAVVTVTLESGTDVTPSAILLGTPSLSGTVVTQMVQDGVNFCDYRLTCAATHLTETYIEDALLPVREAFMD